jgi:hypothetical protein
MEQDLINRIELIERRNKILFFFLIFLTLAFGVVLRYEYKKTAVSDHLDKLVVNSIEAHFIKVIGSDDENGAIEVVNSNSYGKNAVSLEATRDGWAALSFYDLRGDLKASLILTPSGKPSLDLFGEKGKGARTTLGVLPADMLSDKDEEFSLQLKDANGKVIWHPNVKNPY